MFSRKGNIVYGTLTGLLVGASLYLLTPLHYLNVKFSYEPQPQKPAVVQEYRPNSEKGIEEIAQDELLEILESNRLRIVLEVEGFGLNYDSLQGNYPFERLEPQARYPNIQFYKSKEEFLENNRDGKPHSLVFYYTNRKNEKIYSQLAWGKPFVEHDVFYFSSRLYDFCTTPDENKIAAWQKLVARFEHGKPVDISLIYAIINDEVVGGDSCPRFRG